MSKKLLHGVIAIAFALGTIGCEGGTSGSVMGSRQSCKDSISGGLCKGSFKKLSDTYSADIGMTRSGFNSVVAELTASVESGPVRVYLKAPDGTQVSAEIRPGSPATISGEAESYYDSFRVYFEALEGEARGVDYTVEYTFP